MPKQVRIRRGTTAQHATFTGADGELTFDTTKKVLVAHDGVTPGGRPLDGWVKLDPGNILVAQEIKGPVNLTGGDLESPGLSVTSPTVLGELVANGAAELKNLAVQQ